MMQLIHAQEGVPFSTNKQLYIKGNSILISNNILGTQSAEPLMNDNIPNNMVKMEYIDVDDDKRTFSSSEATINLPIDAPKIAYAALYWSALYPFERGVLRRSGNKMEHKGFGERNPEVNTILFKKSNKDYIPITGKTIFDSFNNDVFATNTPYVCYADVTSLMQNLPSINGAYTVANIKATEGEVFGGGAAGWLLYIVYEDPEESPKYFATYNGLIGLSEEPMEMTYRGFLSKEEGDIKTTISLGALEGDRNLKNDKVSIFYNKKEEYVDLGNSLRKKGNFFNSSITEGDTQFTDRTPNSSNTLGFDVLKMDIPNPKNKYINNATTEVKLKFESKKDLLYLFFMAFETEIKNSLYELKKAEELKRIAFIEQAAIENQKINESKTVISASGETITSLSIPGVEKGYYLVTNIFSEPEKASDWINLLVEKEFNPKAFVSPKNNWQYVYVFNDENPALVFNKKKELSGLYGFKGLLVYKVN